MKKNGKYIMVVFAVILMTGVTVFAYLLQKNKESVAERTGDKLDRMNKEAIATEEAKGERNDSDIVGDNILMIGAVKLEMLSADIFEGDAICEEKTYPVENFQSKTLPEKQTMTEVIDWDSIFEESPEYEKFHLADFGEYTEEEENEIADKYEPLINKYTYIINKPQKLYLIKCRLTNLSENVIEDTLPLDVSAKSMDTGEVEYDADICYFDKAIYTEGSERDMKYYFFRLDGNESMECTIGLAVPQAENEKYYYGEPVTGDTPYDPEMLPDFIDIDALPITNK
mgnify:FL=1